jgi:hypothetical protein
MKYESWNFQNAQFIDISVSNLSEKNKIKSTNSLDNKIEHTYIGNHLMLESPLIPFHLDEPNLPTSSVNSRVGSEKKL